MATSSCDSSSPCFGWALRSRLGDPDHQLLALGGLVGELDGLVQVVEEVLGRGGIEGELVVRHGERGILGDRLLEQLAAIVRAEVLTEGAALEVEIAGLGGRGGDGNGFCPRSALAPAVEVALADSVPDFPGLQAVRVESRAAPASTAVDEVNARGIWSSGSVSEWFELSTWNGRGPIRAYGGGKSEFQRRRRRTERADLHPY